MIELLQDAAARTALPADPVIDGPFWTIVVPAILFLISATATFLLYRHFLRAGQEE
ncbi:MAG: hypothetical protein KAJ42_04590 [Gemmatimonadetes bacterium]|nr:hypothetical protein [Gemmatimonadota bacterium]